MATRSGSVDPGLVLWLLRTRGSPPTSSTTRSSTDVRPPGPGRHRRHARGARRAPTRRASARLALDVYVHRLRGAIAAMAAALGGLDVLVFTGGVGERAARSARWPRTGLGFLGVALDPAPTPPPTATRRSPRAGGGGARVVVVTAREDLEIARQAAALLD